MHVGVVRDVVHERVVLRLIRELAMTKQPRNFEEGRALRELLDWISAG